VCVHFPRAFWLLEASAPSFFPHNRRASRPFSLPPALSPVCNRRNNNQVVRSIESIRREIEYRRAQVFALSEDVARAESEERSVARALKQRERYVKMTTEEKDEKERIRSQAGCMMHAVTGERYRALRDGFTIQLGWPNGRAFHVANRISKRWSRTVYDQRAKLRTVVQKLMVLDSLTDVSFEMAFRIPHLLSFRLRDTVCDTVRDTNCNTRTNLQRSMRKYRVSVEDIKRAAEANRRREEQRTQLMPEKFQWYIARRSLLCDKCRHRMRVCEFCEHIDPYEWHRPPPAISQAADLIQHIVYGMMYNVCPTPIGHPAPAIHWKTPV